MNANQKLDMLKGLLQKSQTIKEKKKGINNEIGSIKVAIEEAIMNEDKGINLKKMLQDEKTQISYRKHLNSNLNQLNANLNDCIMGVGEMSPNQLDFYDLENVKKDFDNKTDEEKEAIPDDKKEEDEEKEKENFLKVKKKKKKVS